LSSKYKKKLKKYLMGVVSMKMIYSVKTSGRKPKLKAVFCPNCHKGRISDVPSACETQVVYEVKKEEVNLVMKCHLCGAPIFASAKE
jgi:ribosomal protein S27AE